ncbi:galactose-binding domain-like protein [Piptocephalis cylindrospora]|uniref:Galactose-binding domain-like protein n=1 Tax=Piptocephalis cylindrospora TaxID=1907219 RepID=A0A4P9Y0Y7_9FUNG|nr:galactose-binding domain-like protein [Piptocephalis cylindrospora]|eukprot:RKP12344.1 galactose-binding domain-like protein [Piptocephalis cylindrospora]
MPGCEHEHVGHGHDHDHDHVSSEEPTKDFLYECIDLENVRVLNSTDPTSGIKLIKPWHRRLDTTDIVESDADDQLIIHVPFTGNVRLNSILLRTFPDDSAPKSLKVYTNREDVDFETVEASTATQEWELAQGASEISDYRVRASKFSNVHCITLFFPESFDGDTSKLSFLGFRGDWIQAKKEPVVTVYEARPNVKDHQVPGANTMNHSLM